VNAAKKLRKPREVFDREREWESLVRFVADPSARARLGIVYGRRRQGKSWLLERISNRVGGWYWEAIEGTSRQQLDALASAFRDWTKLPARPHFEGWSEALQAVWQAGPPVVVLDEVQHLVASAPELPSILQTRVSREGGPRLILCGSALGPMRGLLGSDAPLRGRASLELIVGPFDYRIAARYWRAKENITAVQSLEAALQSNTVNWQSHLLLAYGYAKVGEYDKARSEAARAAELNKDKGAVAGVEQRLRKVFRAPAALLTNSYQFSSIY